MVDLLACRVCLATDVTLHNIFENRLQNSYEKLTGYQINFMDGLPKHLCRYCIMLLKKYVHFKDICFKTQDLLLSALKNDYEITTDYIRSIDKTSHQLTFFNTSPIEITEFPQVKIKEECDTKDIVSIDNAEIKLENYQSDEEPLSKKKKKRRKKKAVVIKIENNELKFNDSLNNDLGFDDSENIDLEFDDSQNNDLEFNDSQNEVEFNDTENIKNDIQYNDIINGNDIEVVLLTKEQQIEEVQVRKESYNYLNSFYKCEKCFKGFITNGTYQNHMIRHDIKSGPHTCDICHTRWPDRRSLRAHKIISHERKFICKLCDHVTKSNHRAKEHSKWHGGFKFDCKICSATFAKSTSYFTHVRLQHPSTFSCEVCGESFIGENGLNMHKKKAHRNVEKSKHKLEHQCLQCGVQFKSVDALKQHSSLALGDICDSNLRPCVICGLSFSTGEEFIKHARSHQNRVAARCEQCDRNFVHERSFAIHNQRVHLGVKHKYKKPDLKRKAVVVCEMCGKKCISKATLVYHQRTHTGEKPYNCTECPKSFSVYQRLQIHIRTHTGERPYKCTHCPKAFKHKAALNRHDRVHSGAKPYQCPHCGKSFSQSNSMKLHVKTVHLKMPAPYRSRRNNKSNE